MVAILLRVEAVVERVDGARCEAERRGRDQRAREQYGVVPRVAEHDSSEHEPVLYPVQRDAPAR
jgi:hypothetical protein